MTRTPGRPAARRLLAATFALALAPAGVGLVLAAEAPPADAAACTIKGTSGADRLQGTAGNDVICGLGGADVLISGGGREDILLGGTGDDRLASSGTRYALLEGGDGNDRLVGGTGQDSLRGGAGRDVLLGGDGPDGLHGGAGNDSLDGQAGNDTARWEPGADIIRGGTGTDALGYYDAPRRVTVTLDGVANDGTVGEGDNVAADVDTVGGSKYADTLTGDGSADRLSGFDGVDLIIGGGGADTLDGNNDDDELRGGAGNDRLVGGDGEDLMVGADGADSMQGEGGNTPDTTSPGNVCDSDPADTVRLCIRDDVGPTFIVTPASHRVAPGGTFTFEEVRVVDDAGAFAVQLDTTFNGNPVSWCSGVMDVVYRGPGGTARLVDKNCQVPAGAPEGAYEMVFSATDRLGFTGVSSEVRRYGFMVSSTADADPPVVTDVSVARSSYAPGEQVRVTITANDASGIHTVYTSLRPSGDSAFNTVCPDFHSFRTGGTMADGVWTFECDLPTGATPGSWSVDVSAHDTYGVDAFAIEGATFTVAP